MIREDTNKNIIERFPSMESDLKLHAIPQLNKNKEDIWTAIKILAFYAVLGVYAYYKYMEMTVNRIQALPLQDIRLCFWGLYQ